MKIYFLINDDINTLTGGYIYNKYIVNGLNEKNYDVSVISLLGNFPNPTSSDLNKCSEILNTLPDKAFLVVDSLILGFIPQLLIKIRERTSIIGLMHLPLSIDLKSNKKQRLFLEEEKALELCKRIITTSFYTKILLTESGIDAEKILVAEPGTENYPKKENYPCNPYNLVCISNYHENKNQIALIKALKNLVEYNWEMNFFGRSDTFYFRKLKELVYSYNLDKRIFLGGPLERSKISDIYLKSDLFILPTKFETYGMALTEALAHGIPVITTLTGGISYSVPASMAIFVKPTVKSLVAALKKVFIDHSVYKKLCDSVSEYNPVKWNVTINRFEEALLISQ